MNKLVVLVVACVAGVIYADDDPGWEKGSKDDKNVWHLLEDVLLMAGFDRPLENRIVLGRVLYQDVSDGRNYNIDYFNLSEQRNTVLCTAEFFVSDEYETEDAIISGCHVWNNALHLDK